MEECVLATKSVKTQEEPYVFEAQDGSSISVLAESVDIRKPLVVLVNPRNPLQRDDPLAAFLSYANARGWNLHIVVLELPSQKGEGQPWKLQYAQNITCFLWSDFARDGIHKNSFEALLTEIQALYTSEDKQGATFKKLTDKAVEVLVKETLTDNNHREEQRAALKTHVFEFCAFMLVLQETVEYDQFVCPAEADSVYKVLFNCVALSKQKKQKDLKRLKLHIKHGEFRRRREQQRPFVFFPPKGESVSLKIYGIDFSQPTIVFASYDCGFHFGKLLAFFQFVHEHQWKIDIVMVDTARRHIYHLEDQYSPEENWGEKNREATHKKGRQWSNYCFSAEAKDYFSPVLSKLASAQLFDVNQNYSHWDDWLAKGDFFPYREKVITVFNDTTSAFRIAVDSLMPKFIKYREKDSRNWGLKASEHEQYVRAYIIELCAVALILRDSGYKQLVHPFSSLKGYKAIFNCVEIILNHFPSDVEIRIADIVFDNVFPKRRETTRDCEEIIYGQGSAIFECERKIKACVEEMQKYARLMVMYESELAKLTEAKASNIKLLAQKKLQHYIHRRTILMGLPQDSDIARHIEATSLKIELCQCRLSAIEQVLPFATSEEKNAKQSSYALHIVEQIEKSATAKEVAVQLNHFAHVTGFLKTSSSAQLMGSGLSIYLPASAGSVSNSNQPQSPTENRKGFE